MPDSRGGRVGEGALGWLNSIRRLAWRAGRLLLPPCCVLCGGEGKDIDLCEACAASLPRLGVACARCATTLALPAGHCPACRRRAALLDAVHAPFAYAAPLDGLIQRYKFAADLAAGRVLGSLLAAHLGPGLAGAVLVPVPLHASRLRQRGFDQALELARDLARRLDLDLAGSALRRTVATTPQSSLPARQRRRNLRAAFAPGPALARLQQRRVVLVDDVLTTGATLHACAAWLRRGGVATVEAVVIASSDGPGRP